MAKPTVVVTRAMPREALDLLARHFDVDANEADRAYTPSELVSHADRADALVAFLTDRIDDGLLASCPRLKVVANVAVGYDNIDVPAATRRGVLVTNTPGVLTDATADFAFALLLAVVRRIVEADRYVRDGKFKAWLMMGLHGYDLGGRTLGIAGFGRIGQAVARRGRAFGMKILYSGNRRAATDIEDALEACFVDKATLLASSDILSLHVPLNAATRHYLGDAEFGAMRPTAFVVNTARGPVIDEEALVRALRSGTIRGAALDVFEREPEVHPELIGMTNVVLAPHIGSATVETRTKMAMMAAENAIAAASGTTPPNLVRG